ncbi:metal-dependent hydrolase [Candidatus Woesearchaeota archaeon]|nr:metal-dependent hydrolase [Candidatus Woesearchaeota archaeon]
MAIGLLVALIAAPVLASDQKVVFVVLVVFGSLLPDVDHKGSKINRLLPVTKLVATFFRHRGFFHSIFPPLIILGIGYYYEFILVAQALAIGYLSHLLSDSFTKLGVNYLYPVSQFRVMGFIEVGTIWESVLFAGVILSIVIMLI